MKTSKVSAIVVLLLSFFILPDCVQAKYSGGLGTAGDPYQIGSAADLLTLAADTNDYGAYFILTADIDLGSSGTFTTAVIARDTDNSTGGFQGTYFTGNFDGDGHKISNLTINGAGNDYLSLFGFIGSGGQIKNLTLENVNITGGDNSEFLGGLVGCNWGSINNCYSTGTVSGSQHVGGLVGGNDGGSSISNCNSTGAVTGGDNSYYLGGLVGYSYGSISNCYATGSVAGGYNSQFLGGLVGGSYNSSISNCYSTGTVIGGDSSSYLGGLAGYNSSGCSISNCYSTGAVTGGSGSTNVGGLVGSNGGTVTACFWDKDTSGQATSAGGTGKTTAEMKMQSSFVGWDFVGETANGTNDFWAIIEGVDYPKLSAFGRYTGGTGTDDNPFQIATVADLLTLATNTSNYDKYFILTADIDLGSSGPFTTAVIARDTDTAPGFNGVTFTGNFDGDGHTISNLTIDTGGAGNDYLGLFGFIGSGGQIKNLTLENVNITGGDNSEFLGGLVGYNNGGSTSNCYSTGAVNGGDTSGYLGGLVGYNNGGSTSNCYSTGAVSGGDYSYYLGGLAGDNDGTISNCYSTGTVAGGNNSEGLGGLVGYNNGGTISNCYSTGTVSGTSNLGGLVGKNYGGNISSCYFLVISGPDNTYGEPLTDAQMKQQSSFVGWDFVNIWHICEDVDYPELAWAYVYVPLSPPAGVSATDGTYNDHIRVTWNSVSGATGYEVWRSANDSSGLALKLEDYISPYDDYSVTEGTTYYYWVKAKNSCGTSGFSSSDSGYASSCAAPSAPTGVSASDGTYNDHIRVTWNSASGATGYEVWRNTSNNSGTAIKSGDYISPFDDNSVTTGTTYYYWVKAKNSCGTSDFNSSDPGYTSTNPNSSVSITKCAVTAGRKANSDKISFSGTMDANADDFNDADTVEVTIDSNDMVNPCVKTFPINANTFKNGKFKCSASNASFVFDTKTSKFSFTAKNVDLSGLSCPLTVRIEINSYVGAAEVDETVVNGPKKPIPTLLMMGVKDVLRVDKCTVKYGKKSDSDQLSVKGCFAVEDTDVDMVNEEFVVTLDLQTFTLPAGSFKAGKGGFTCTKADANEGGTVDATFNFTTCSFILTIKNMTITAGSGAVDFCVAFADYSQCVQVTLPTAPIGTGGTALRILPGYTLSACIDSTGGSHVNPQTLMAAGGSPFAGYTWSTSGFPMGTTVWPLTGVFVSNGGLLIAENRTFTVEVSDGTSTKTGSVTLNVTTPGAGCPWAVLQQYPSSSFALDDAKANKPYGASLFAMGGTPPYTWSEDTSYSGRGDFDLSGLTIGQSSGIVRGTLFNSSSGKTLRFRVIVRDNAGDTAVDGPIYTITVK